MSSYNMACGFDPNIWKVLHVLGLHPLEDVPRFRDAWADPEKNRLVVLTRVGGNNRAEYPVEISKLQSHPRYLDDFDDDFDNTFAYFEFSVPEDDPIPEGTPKPGTLKERLDKAIKRMQERFRG